MHAALAARSQDSPPLVSGYLKEAGVRLAMVWLSDSPSENRTFDVHTVEIQRFIGPRVASLP